MAKRRHLHKSEKFYTSPPADVILQWHDWTGIGATLITAWALNGLTPLEDHWDDRAYVVAHLSQLNELWENPE